MVGASLPFLAPVSAAPYLSFLPFLAAAYRRARLSRLINFAPDYEANKRNGRARQSDGEASRSRSIFRRLFSRRDSGHGNSNLCFFVHRRHSCSLCLPVAAIGRAGTAQPTFLNTRANAKRISPLSDSSRQQHGPRHGNAALRLCPRSVRRSNSSRVERQTLDGCKLVGANDRFLLLDDTSHRTHWILHTLVFNEQAGRITARDACVTFPPTETRQKLFDTSDEPRYPARGYQDPTATG